MRTIRRTRKPQHERKDIKTAAFEQNSTRLRMKKYSRTHYEPRQHLTSKTVSAKRRRNRRRFLNENKPTIVTTAGTPPRTRAQASARTNTFTQARPLTIKRTATCTHRQTHARNADDSFVFRRVAAKCVSRAHIQTHHGHARKHTTAHKQPPTNNTLNTLTEYTHIRTRGQT